MYYTEMLRQEKLGIPDKWAALRPEQLTPSDFIDLTADIFGEAKDTITTSNSSANIKDAYVTRPIWRRALYPNSAAVVPDEEE